MVSREAGCTRFRCSVCSGTHLGWLVVREHLISVFEQNSIFWGWTISTMRKQFFRLAKKEASKSRHSKYQLGCVIVKKKTVLSRGNNTDQTHPVFGINGWHKLHAETHALSLARSHRIDVDGADIYVYRKGYKLAKPCSNCYNALIKAGIKNIYYTDHRV